MSKWMSKAVDRRSLLVGMAGLAASGDALAANFKPDWQRRNMASFAAPSVDRVRMAIIGCGKRAKTLVKSLTDVDGVAIVSVCDLRAEEAEATAALVSEKGLPVPKTIHGDEIAYRQAFDDEIDVVYICTPWEWHAPMAIDAMNAGAHAAVEVPLATTADELWAMIRTSETTGKHCFLLENACYVREEMALRRMTQAGVLGDVVHTEGSYIHDSRHLYANYGYFPDLWFVSNSLTRNGNLYPTHGIGPVALVMNAGANDGFANILSVSSPAAGMEYFARTRELPDRGIDFSAFAEPAINLSLIRLKSGRTILARYSRTVPIPYSRDFFLQGTKGAFMRFPKPAIAIDDPERKSLRWDEEAAERLIGEHLHPVWQRLSQLDRKVLPHEGADLAMNISLVENLREGRPMDFSVYDAADWSVIAPLSEASVAGGSVPMAFPDFRPSA